MNKDELVKHVAAVSGIPQRDVRRVLDIATSTIAEMMIDGEKVSLVGFGVFEPRVRASKIGYDPVTREPIVLPSYIHTLFRPSLNLKKYVNGCAD